MDGSQNRIFNSFLPTGFQTSPVDSTLGHVKFIALTIDKTILKRIPVYLNERISMISTPNFSNSRQNAAFANIKAIPSHTEKLEDEGTFSRCTEHS